jgi:fermentation-respiration switch protein FrsA (DUF1100 family)
VDVPSITMPYLALVGSLRRAGATSMFQCTSGESFSNSILTPVLFVQGSRDALCPQDRLASVRARMKAPNQLHVVEGGDHSLTLTKTALKASGTTQDAVDAAVVDRIADFLKAVSPG